MTKPFTRRLLLATFCAFAASGAFAAATITVSRSMAYAADPAKTWDAVKDFGALDAWHPAVEMTEIKSGTDNKPGAVRLLSLKGGGTVTETLTSYDAKAHSMGYRILDGVLPVEGYKSVIAVKANGSGGSKLVWSSSFKAKKGTSDADAKKAIEGSQPPPRQQPG